MPTRSRFTVVLVVLVVLAVCVCVAVGAPLAAPVGAQSTPVVTFGTDSATADDTTTVTLVATDVPSAGVGAYNVTVTHDADTLDLSVDGTDRFTTTTSRDGSSGTVETTIVGYTGASSDSGGNVTLASLTLTATGDGQSTLSVDEVTTVADPDGNDIGGTDGDTTSISAVGGGDGGDGGGGGGAGPVTTPETETTATPGTPETTATAGETPSTSDTPEPTTTPVSTGTVAATETPGGVGPGFSVVVTVITTLLLGLLARRHHH